MALWLGPEVTPAQVTTQAATKKTAQKTKPGVTAIGTKPVLEPKAIELLKASCARLAARAFDDVYCGDYLRKPQSYGIPARLHDKVRGCHAAS